MTAFALSDLGETVHLCSAVNDILTDYHSKEDFGATAAGETLGTYYKPGENTYNFVAMAVPTPGATNSAPRVGPVVISEIMYNPPGSGDADEYFELVNISAAPVTLFDEVKQKPWRVTDGVDYDFPVSPPLTLAPGQRVLLARNLAALEAAHATIPPELPRVQWTTGALDNGGETLQIAKPGGVDAFNVTQYIRVDRVNYDDAAPWVTAPDGNGPALTRINESAYGNDAANWRASYPSAGLPEGSRYSDWVLFNGLGGPGEDPDLDGQSNLLEYALGTNPHVPDAFSPLSISVDGDQARVSYGLRLSTTDLNYHLEASPDLASWTRVNTSPEPGGTSVQTRVYRDTTPLDRRYFRLGVELKP
ncbi:MAG: lamin tail domain-containing protein [Kiritimatiellia bacterium]